MKLTLLLLVALSASVSIAAPFSVRVEKGPIICGSEKHRSMVYKFLAGHILSGEITLMEVINLEKASGTKEEKKEMIVDFLRNNNLYSPPCKPQD